MKCRGCKEDMPFGYNNTVCKKCLNKLEYGSHEKHPEWRLLNEYCSYKERAETLRSKIDKEIFNKRLLKNDAVQELNEGNGKQ